MILLDSTNKLQITTSGTANIDYYINLNNNAFLGKISSATTITVSPSTIPAVAMYIIIGNVHAATANTITLSLKTKDSSYILFKCELLAGERIIYNSGDFKVYAADGSLK